MWEIRHLDWRPYNNGKPNYVSKEELETIKQKYKMGKLNDYLVIHNYNMALNVNHSEFKYMTKESVYKDTSLENVVLKAINGNLKKVPEERYEDCIVKKELCYKIVGPKNKTTYYAYY